jgi:hypothetical protein
MHIFYTLIIDFQIRNPGFLAHPLLSLELRQQNLSPTIGGRPRDF